MVELVDLCVKEIMRLHGLPKSIISDRDPKFIAQFCREVHHLLGAKLLMSMVYHPQMDGQLSVQIVQSCKYFDQWLNLIRGTGLANFL